MVVVVVVVVVVLVVMETVSQNAYSTRLQNVSEETNYKPAKSCKTEGGKIQDTLES